MSFFPDAILCLLAYLSGSLSAAIIVSKAMGLPDPRLGGSGNPGTTNVLRLGGKKAAVFTLVGDLLKGTIPVLIARFFTDSTSILSLIGLCAFLGHLYPIFYGFKGGKGVATFLGVLLGLKLTLFFTAVITWLVVAVIFRFSSLAALMASLATLFAAFLWTGLSGAWIFIALIVITLFIKHRANISRLIQGTEPKIGKKS